ncbi:MAG: amidohydrolase family protein, partial [Bacteroidales bacterium]|nr:amidohydrolase family protein [Bacteroidales bacterium]
IDKVDPSKVCGIKLFMGSSTGNMLVDNYEALATLFKNASLPIVAHCEDENIIKRNSETFRQLYGDDVPLSYHPLIRDRKACLTSSEKAIKLAQKYDARLHIAHVTTADEVKLFSNDIPLSSKKITAEACIGHICLDDSMYDALGTHMKVNPAIKTKEDKKRIIKGIINNSIDTIATDHAPHTLSEKNASYFKAPSGAPVVQHSLVAMLELWKNGAISIEKIVEKMCHNPAIIFNIQKRGFIRKGYKADICLFNPNNSWTVSSENIYHKCGWSLFDKKTFNTSVETTIVNGNIVYKKGLFTEDKRGERLSFDR